MGHYASEMDPNWGRRIEEQDRLRRRGYVHTELGYRKVYLCTDCSAVVTKMDTHDLYCPAKEKV
jgi:hypothetical protein